MATMAENSDSRQGQVQVYFTTTSEDIELPEGKRQLLVPIDVRRYGLSQILNSSSMLDTPSPIPFDFLINGTFLRTTISEYLTAAGLSSETTLTLTYIRSLIPPLYEKSFEHDDWVSCIDVLSSSSVAGKVQNAIAPGHERVLSGSYDGLLRIWNKEAQVLGTSTSPHLGGHTSAIKSAKFISSTSLASSSLDRTVRIWKYTEADQELKPVLELYGHRASVDSLAIHAPSSRILSASQDGSIGLWSTQKSENPAAPASLISSVGPIAKRRKLTTATSTPQRGALALMPIHSSPATAVIFHSHDSSVAYSTSLDHTVRTIDLTTATVVDTRTTGHSLLSLAALPSVSGGHVLAVGTAARHVTVVDPRVESRVASVMTLRGHANKVVSVSGQPGSVWGLVSGSHDGTCRVWDLRSTRAGGRDEGGGVVGESVYVIEREGSKGRRKVGGEGVKVFGVEWNEEVGIVSAGEDKRVQINRGKDVIPAQET